jgi:acyl-CoA dehydrogenase
MLGFRATHTGQLAFDDVKLGNESVLGEVGGGFYALMRRLAWERIYMSICAASAAEQSLETAVSYARAAKAAGSFDRIAASVQRLPDLATRTAQARALVEHALRTFIGAQAAGTDLDTNGRRVVAQTKLYTQRVALDVADEAVQIHGAAGFNTSSPVERYWRDARLGPIGGGTDEIMREIIAEHL